MPIQVDALYENGVLRPLQPLDLEEQEHVVLSMIKAAPASGRSSLAVEYIEKIKRGLPAAEPGPELDEVRRRLAKIPGSMAAEVVAERGVLLATTFGPLRQFNLAHPKLLICLARRFSASPGFCPYI